MTKAEKPSFQMFQAAFLELMSAYRSQLMIRVDESQEEQSRRKLAGRLLAPYRELEPHDVSLLDLVFQCEGITDAEEITEKILILYQARHG